MTGRWVFSLRNGVPILLFVFRSNAKVKQTKNGFNMEKTRNDFGTLDGENVVFKSLKCFLVLASSTLLEPIFLYIYLFIFYLLK